MPGQCSGNWLSFVCHWSSSCRCVVFISKLKNERKKCFTIFLVQESVVEIGTAMLISAVQMLKLAVFSQVYVQYIPDIFHLKNASFDNSKFSNDIFKARKGLGWGAQWENDIHGGKGMHVTNICFFTVKRQLLCNFRSYFNF